MLHELADESENQGLKMNKSKTKVVMENDIPIYTNNTQIENYLGQTKTRTFKEKSWPDGQHSPSNATSSRVTLEHAWKDKSITHAYFQQ